MPTCGTASDSRVFGGVFASAQSSAIFAISAPSGATSRENASFQPSRSSQSTLTSPNENVAAAAAAKPASGQQAAAQAKAKKR